MSSNNDDDFDWAAAVEEIDKACSRHVGQESWGSSEPSTTQSRALQQRTLDSFVRGGVGQRSNVTEAPAQHGTGGALDSSRQWVGDQRPTGTDDGTRQVSSDGVEASSSGCRLPLDYDAARVWIYPANVPRRSYQFNMAKSALFSNTLVCLPTGLGKTLIAAVVMFNYFRWFPTGKIVFTAPSRPLVVQQIEACHKVTGIPQNMTIDMTGQMNPQIRAEHWRSKRVFFVTPQVLEKDIQAGRAATKQIVCLVVDEAHRATGNYSYCVVVRELLAAKVEPRILALTATPGSKRITIQAVVDNLQISSLEYRDEHDPDVSQYTHNRRIELIEVAMNAESIQVKDVFIEVLQPIVHRLCYLGVFYSREILRLTPYEFLTARDKFREAPPQALHQSKYQEVETYFGLAITLFHTFKLLITHGMRPAYEMLREKVEHGVLKRLAKNEQLRQVQDLMKQSIGHGAPNPKLEKVVDIINDHFSVHDATKTRVIVFTNYRESVKDIMDKLAAACESVKAMEFIGQSSGKTSKGQTQKTQQAVLQRFRGGCYNTIVATSIAEEGLDIMEVDLVICFDANISPLRMIQRMGRTGRKRDGRVVVLASGGSEIQGYLKKQSKSKALGKHMLNGGLQSFNFHASHHMIPHSLRTSVQFVELAIEDFVPRGRKLKEKDFKAAAGPRKLTEKELEIVRLVKAIPDLNPRMKGGPEDPVNKFFACPVYQVRHSKRSCLLMDCLQTLGVPVELTYEERNSRDNIISPSAFELPVKSNIPIPVNEIQVPESPLCENLSDDGGPDLHPKKLDSAAPTYVLPSSVASSPDPCRIQRTYRQNLPSPKVVLSEQRHQEGVVGPDLHPKKLESAAQAYVLPSSVASSPDPCRIQRTYRQNLPSPKVVLSEQRHQEGVVGPDLHPKKLESAAQAYVLPSSVASSPDPCRIQRTYRQNLPSPKVVLSEQRHQEGVVGPDLHPKKLESAAQAYVLPSSVASSPDPCRIQRTYRQNLPSPKVVLSEQRHQEGVVGPDLHPKKLESAAQTYVLPSSVASSPDPCRIQRTYRQNLPSPKVVLSEQRHQEGVVAGDKVSLDKLKILEGPNKPVPYPDHDEHADGHFAHLKKVPLTPITNKVFSAAHMLSGDHNAKLVTQAVPQIRSFPLSEQPGVDYHQTLDKLQWTGFHRSKYSAGVISVTQSGLVLIASPPSLLLSRKVEAKCLPKPSDHCDSLRVNSEAVQQRETEPNNKTEQRQPSDFSPPPSPLANQSSNHATPVCHRAVGRHTVECIAATPDEKVVDSCSKEAGQQNHLIQARALDFEELSPRLAEFANHGVVPSTPRKASNPVSEKASVPSLPGTDLTEGRPYLPSDGQTHIPPMRSTLSSQKPPRNSISNLLLSSTPAEEDVQCQGGSPQKTMGLTRMSAFAHPSGGFSPLQPRNLMHTKARPHTFDYLKTDRLPLRDRPIPEVNNGSILSNLEETLEPVGDYSEAKTRSPLQIQSSKSSEEDWKINEGAALGSVQKPRKLKRLRRVCEKPPLSSVEKSLKRSLSSSVQDHVKSKMHHSRVGRDKHQKKLAARSFIDDEAVDSSEDEDDDSSGKEDFEDDVDSSLEGFIDTAATQYLNGSVDMINIYRKSLLTQSPLGCPGAQESNLRQRNATPSSDVTPSSIEPSSASRGLEDEISDFSAEASVKRSSFVRPQNIVQTTRILDLEEDSAKGEGKYGEAFGTDTALGGQDEQSEDKDRSKAEYRKRKLSFQSSSTYEDDLFEGVDLDALEAEATEISRMRTQGQVVSSNAFQEQVVARPGPRPSRLTDDNEFEFIPSFDLGLGT